jgi:hypothetical protein
MLPARSYTFADGGVEWGGIPIVLTIVGLYVLGIWLALTIAGDIERRRGR